MEMLLRLKYEGHQLEIFEDGPRLQVGMTAQCSNGEACSATIFVETKLLRALLEGLEDADGGDA